jgi:hypothetical protein
MRSLRLAALILALLTGACAKRAPEPAVFDAQRAYQLVKTQLAFGPRFPGSQAHRAVGEWIVDQLQGEGWYVEEQRFVYKGVELRNITGRRLSAEGPLVLIGAHYDTRRYADQDPIASSAPVPGANDGASGVAVLLELARILAHAAVDADIRLVFFDAEDQGGIEGWEWIVGSSHYAASLKEDPAAVVVVDMIGDANLEIFFEGNSDPQLMEEIWRTAQALGHGGFRPQYRYTILDDHIPFVRRGIAAVDIIDFDYPYWHTRQDTADKVSPASLGQVGETLLTWLQNQSWGELSTED